MIALLDSAGGAVDHELRQTRLSRFGRVLALITLGFTATNFVVSIWVQRPSFNRHSAPLLVATVAFVTNARAAQWWTAHRHELRSGGAGTSVAVDAHAPRLMVTRIAD